MLDMAGLVSTQTGGDALPRILLDVKGRDGLPTIVVARLLKWFAFESSLSLCE